MMRRVPQIRTLGSLFILAGIALSLCSCRGIPGVSSLVKRQPTPTPAAADSGEGGAPIISSSKLPRPKEPNAGAGTVGAVMPESATPKTATPKSDVQLASYNPPALPPSAYTGAPEAPYYPGGPAPSWSHSAQACACPHCSGGAGGPFRFSSDAGALAMQCAPDGLACPWPADEYICDGGDINMDANVRKDWTVVGVDQEDTIAHYDTLDGKTEITESNKLCIYAPRFAAVRKIVNPIQYEGHERMADVAKADKLNLHEEKRLATTAVQPEQVHADLMIDQALAFRERSRGIGLEATEQLYLTRHGFLPFEDLQAIHRGVFENHEKARLAAATAAALVWETKQAVQVVIDGKLAVEAAGQSAPQETVVYELEGKPRLRIIKIADRSDARPGEIVNFTLRFDNVGEQPVGNVTIVDNLTTRLEYIEGSQSCSLKADFATEENAGQSLVLRWAIIDPLKVNDGGIIRFQCRVR